LPGSVALEARAKGSQRQGPQYPVDGGEGKDEAFVDRVREAFAGDLQYLIYESLPAVFYLALRVC